MIHVNLLPGAGKKPKARGTSIGMGQLLASALARVQDPFLLGAVAGIAVAALAIGAMFTHQQTALASVDAELQVAEQDSIKYSAMIREKLRTEAQRDSVLAELTLIRSIDGRRFVWSHIMDEISRALPPYTWLTQVSQTSGPDQAAAPGTTPTPPPPAPGDTSKAKKKTQSPQALADSLEKAARVQFRIVGNTVDIQALTRFMKLLEASPFVEDVQLVKSAMIIVDGKEVTEFQLDAAFQKPDSAAIRTTPLIQSAR